MLSVAEYASFPQFEALRPEWDALLERAEHGSVFADWCWAAALWRHHPASKSPLVLAVRDATAGLVGLLPLARTRRLRVLPVLEVLGCASNGYPLGDYGGPIAARGMEAAVWTALLDYLARRPGWFVIDLRNCPPGPLAAEQYQAAAAARNWEVRAQPGDTCRRLPLPTSFSAYLERLSANSRQQIRRKLRKLAEAGHRIEAVDGGDRAARDEALEALFAFHQAHWGAAASGGAFPNEPTRALHRDLAARLAARDRLDLRLVRAAGGAPVGVIYNFRQAGVAYFYQLGLSPDPAWATWSLGTCLLADSIAAAIAAGCHTFDLLRGDHDYKRHFGGEPHRNIRLTMYRHRWLPAMESAGRGLRHRLRLSIAPGLSAR